MKLAIPRPDRLSRKRPASGPRALGHERTVMKRKLGSRTAETSAAQMWIGDPVSQGLAYASEQPPGRTLGDRSGTPDSQAEARRDGCDNRVSASQNRVLAEKKHLSRNAVTQ